MKIKHLERSANVAWSPKSQSPILLAAGTAAQQLDATFNNNAALEIYSLNLKEAGPDLELKGSVKSDHKFHKIIWSDHNNGTIIGGCDGGIINIYGVSKILAGEDGLLKSQDKHTGPVHAVDFNPFQQNLFASGASESEIFIWDLNNVSKFMSPGSKTQPLEDVLCVAWNKQVQHILSSVFTSKCVIWDLRKNEPIIKLTDTVSRIRWKQVAWHPEVATQLCLASEEDHSPVIQIWDLRFATSPLKSLEYHQRGVLSIAWCQEDADLLVSCGKDSKLLCWNPNSNQPEKDLTEIAQTNQWIFDIAWCPKNPAIFACSSLDTVSIYSLTGGKTQQIQTSSKIADSFPGMDGYIQAPVPQQAGPTSQDLIRPPKWLKRPVGASFGFGGKLITFEYDKNTLNEAQHNAQVGQSVSPVRRTVQISQVITEPELVQHSNRLEEVLQSGNFKEYCHQKADEINDQHKKYVWHFLKANFDDNPRAELLNLLGYRIEDVNGKLNELCGLNLQNNVDNLTNQLSNMNRIEDYNNDVFDSIGKKEAKLQQKFKIKTGNDTEGLITQALLLGNVEAAVEFCLKAKRYADAIIIAMTGGTDLLARTQHKYLEQSEGYVSSLISALVSEDWGSIINNCDTSSWKEALAATLTHCSDEELPVLCEQLGNRLEEESLGNPKLAQDAQLCYICSGRFDKLVNSWIKKASKSTGDIQELVELVSFLQKAIERQGRHVQISGALADLLSHYASLLASQGSLSSALSYLGYSDDPRVTALRERLLVALGQRPLGPAARRSTAGYSDQVRFPYRTSYQPQGLYQPATPPAVPSHPPVFNTGFSSSGALYGQSPPKPFSPGPSPMVPPPPQQPPRPASVSSNQGSSGLPSRKYIVDPSVSSSSYGASYGAVPPVPFHQPSFQSPVPLQPSFPIQPGPIPASSMSSVPQMNSMSSIPPSMSFAPPPMASLPPTMSSAPPPVSVAPPLSQVPPVSSSLNRFNRSGSRTTSFSENEVMNVPGQVPLGYGGVERAEPAQNYALNSPPGWNDPPNLNYNRHNKPKPSVPQEPITHPLFGTAPPNEPAFGQPYPGSQPPPMFGQENIVNNNMQYSKTFDPNSFNQNATSFNQGPASFNQSVGNYNQNAMGYNQNIANNVGYNQNMLDGTPEIPQPIQKPPIPEEHVHMKDVFDQLRERCNCAAANPQIKRKLEEVAKKLETLYDLLREQALSQNTLSNLHELVNIIQQGNYTGALQLYTQLASGPDFSQIASFMPGIKILISCALQLQVYLS